jgi:hypothetical protein
MKQPLRTGALFQQGKILSIDTPSGIIEKFPKKLWAVVRPICTVKTDLDKI